MRACAGRKSRAAARQEERKLRNLQSWPHPRVDPNSSPDKRETTPRGFGCNDTARGLSRLLRAPHAAIRSSAGLDSLLALLCNSNPINRELAHTYALTPYTFAPPLLFYCWYSLIEVNGMYGLYIYMYI